MPFCRELTIHAFFSWVDFGAVTVYIVFALRCVATVTRCFVASVIVLGVESCWRFFQLFLGEVLCERIIVSGNVLS